jgi:hypothetical protein
MHCASPTKSFRPRCAASGSAAADAAPLRASASRKSSNGVRVVTMVSTNAGQRLADVDDRPVRIAKRRHVEHPADNTPPDRDRAGRGRVTLAALPSNSRASSIGLMLAIQRLSLDPPQPYQCCWRRLASAGVLRGRSARPCARALISVKERSGWWQVTHAM